MYCDNDAHVHVFKSYTCYLHIAMHTVFHIFKIFYATKYMSAVQILNGIEIQDVLLSSCFHFT